MACGGGVCLFGDFNGNFIAMMQKKRRLIILTPDKTLLTLIACLLIFGVIMVYDATAVFSQSSFGNPYHFALLQVIWVLVGLASFYFFYRIDYRKIRSLAFFLFIFSFLILLFIGILSLTDPCPGKSGVIFTPCINGARRWFYFNPPPLPSIPVLGILGFQPSELAKLTLILYLGVLLEKHVESVKIGQKKTPFSIYMVISGITALLVFLQPNFSTAGIIFGIGTLMYLSSGANLLPLFIAGPLAFVTGLFFVLISDYRKARLLTFLDPGGMGDLTLGYHIKQILIALGSGGLFGLGFGQSRQKYQYLPEVSADSIFAVVGEELGFVGTTVLVLVFTLLIYKGYEIAKKAPDLLGRLLASGITSWMALQFVINVAAMLKLLPLTGVTLPLISYGGSSMVFGLMGLGLLANISAKS